MPEERKQQSLDINITGSVDSSLARAIGVTEAQLAKLKDAVNTINKGFSKEAFAPAAEGFKQAETAASNFRAEMGRIGEVMAGVFSADMAMKFFDTAMEGARKLAEFLKESGIQAATMEQMQAQLKIQMPKGTTNKQVENLTNALQYFADTTPFQLSKVFDSFRELLVARVGVIGLDPKTGEYKAADIPRVMEVIQQIGNIAAATTKPGESPSEHYAAIATAIQQSLLGGNLMERTLRPLEQMGLEIRPWLEQKYGLVKGSLGALGSEEDTEALHALYKRIKKGEVPAYDILDYLKSVAGPGGKYEGSTKQLAQGAIGGWSTLLDKFENIMRGIGKIELGPFEGIINKINSAFTPEAYTKIQDFFDKAADRSKQWSDNMIKMFGESDKTGLNKSLNDLIATLTSLAKDFQKAIPDTPAKIQAVVDKLAAIVDLLAGLGQIVRGIDKVISVLQHIDDLLFGWLPKVVQGLAPTLTPAEIEAQKKKAAAGGHVDEPPKKSNYLNEADYQKAVEIYNRKPHAAAGGIVTRATSLIAGEQGPEAILPLAVLRDHPLVRVTEEATKVQLAGVEQSAKETDQIAKLTQTMTQLTQTIVAMPTAAGGGFGGSGGGGPPGFSGMSGGIYYTEYGPSVKGDQPGGPTYDSNSYNRIGAWPGITGKLQPGDVALGLGAQAFYHVRPGDTFVDSRGNTVRFADRSGSKNPMNEDVFRMASGGIITRATRALLGEAGPEAVVPLGQGGGLVTLHYSPTIHGFGDIAGLLRDHADELLQQVEQALASRFAAMANV